MSFWVTGEEKPTFGGGNEAVTIPVVVFCLREFLFGMGSAFGSGIHSASPLRRFVTTRPHSKWPGNEFGQK